MGIEKKTADAILDSIFRVKIGGVTFKAAPPKNSTVIRLSEMASELPNIETNNVFYEVLENAKNAWILADIIALLICGEIEPLKIYSIKSILKHWRRNRKFKKIRTLVLYESSPSETVKVMTEVLGRQDVGGFFTLIISLKSANILKQTREMKTTASGQQSDPRQKR